MRPSDRNVFLIFLLATACCLGGAASVGAADVTIGTGSAGMENIIKKIEHPLKKRKVKLKIVDTGSVQDLKDIDAGKVECVISGWRFADGMAAMMGTTAEDVKSRVIINSGAIGIGTATQVDRLVNAPAIPEISRPITLLTRGTPIEGCQKTIDFVLMDKGGQRYIGK